MSPVGLLLIIIAVVAVIVIVRTSSNLWRSGKIDDEAAERKQLAEEAAEADELEQQFPAASAKQNKNKVDKFSSRT